MVKVKLARNEGCAQEGIWGIEPGEGVASSRDPRYLRWQRCADGFYANAPGLDPYAQGMRYRVSWEPGIGWVSSDMPAETGECWEPIGVADSPFDACMQCTRAALLDGAIAPLR